MTVHPSTTSPLEHVPPRPVLRVIPNESEPSITQAALCRRLRSGLYDLGLSDVVGPDWIRPEGDGFAVGSLSLRSADRLLRRLDALVDELAARAGHRNCRSSADYLSHLALQPPADAGASGSCEQLSFF